MKLLTWYKPKFKLRWLGPSLTGLNCHSDIGQGPRSHLSKQNLSSFFSSKNLSDPNTFGPKYFRWQKIYSGLAFVLVLDLLSTEKNRLGLSNFSYKFFYPTFLDLKILVQNYIDKHNFWYFFLTQIYFKNFGPKAILDTKYFWTTFLWINLLSNFFIHPRIL